MAIIEEMIKTRDASCNIPDFCAVNDKVLRPHSISCKDEFAALYVYAGLK